MKSVRLLTSVIAVAVLVMATLPGSVTAATYRGALPPDPATGLTRNNDGEPGIAVDGSGTFWIGSNVLFNSDPRNADALTGEDVWKSTDGGHSYQWVASPFGVTNTSPGLAGEDSDIAAAPARNANGFYNVYAVSLWVGSTSVAISQDGGKTWTLNPLGGIPAEDRPWVAADGACTFYVAYHQLPSWEPAINRYDVCDPTDLGLGVAINPVSSTTLFESNSVPGLTNVFGKIAVDNSSASPYRHYIYVPMQGCDLSGPIQIVQNADTTGGCLNKTEMFIGVSTNGGKTFNDYKVAEGANGEQSVWCCTASTDRAGTVYFAWTDNHNSWLAASHDGGQTWSSPVRVNKGGTAVYPTVAGGAAGVVKVAFYGTGVTGDANDAAVMKDPNTQGAAVWTLQLAQSGNFGKSFGVSTLTGPIHTGVLCTQGGNCSISDSRNLFDDFGATINPATGTLSIGYTSDQPGGQSANVFTGYTTVTK